MSLLAPLRASADLRRLVVGQLVSQTGDAIFNVAMLWLALELTGSKTAAGTVAMIGYLPALLFGLVGGALADMVDRRRLMLAADLLRAGVGIGLWFCCQSLGHAPLALLLAATFSISLAAAAFNPARDAMLPDLVSDRTLLEANATLQLVGFLPIMLGPALAALLLVYVEVADLFALDALTFLLSAWAIARLSYRATPRARSPLRGELRAAVHLLRRDRRLSIFLLLTAANNFLIMGPALIGTLILVSEELGGNARDFAAVEAFLGLGMVLGCLIVARLGKRFGSGRVLCAGWIWDGLTYAGLYFVSAIWQVKLLVVLHALAIPWIVVCRAALVQEWVEERLRGRIFGLVNAAVVGVTGVSSGFVGYWAESIPASHIFGIFGSLAAITGLIGWFYRPIGRA